MKKIAYYFFTAVSTFFFFSCGKNDTAWQKDCGAFVKTITDLASKSAGAKTDDYNDRFKDKEISWELMFKETSKKDETLYFDLQPYGLDNDAELSSNQPVSLVFYPAPGTFDTWKNVASGSLVKISGNIRKVIMVNMNSGSFEHPGKSTAIALVGLENVKKVLVIEKPKKVVELDSAGIKEDTAGIKEDMNKIFVNVEIEASFPGGDIKWRKYLERELNTNIPTDYGAPEGTYTTMVQFVVDKEGNISDVKSLTNHGYGMEQEAMRTIKKGPKWIPAVKYGHQVKAYCRKPITFQVQD